MLCLCHITAFHPHIRRLPTASAYRKMNISHTAHNKQRDKNSHPNMAWLKLAGFYIDIRKRILLSQVSTSFENVES